MKRVISFILALILLVPMLAQAVPAPGKAATSTDDIRAAVTKAYDDVAKTLNPGESAYDGTLQLLSHALFGGGEDLLMDEDDHFSGLAFGSNMFRDGFIDAMTESFVRLLGNYDEKMLVSGSYSFYEHTMGYYISSVSHFMDVPLDTEESISNPSSNLIERMKTVKSWPGQPNSYDEALILVAGGCLTNYTITKTSVAEDSANYHVSVVFRDNFDFGNGKYNSDDAQLASALTWIGKLMQHGAIVTPFHWEVHLGFDISFNNNCPHQSENFRWEYDGSNITAVSGNGLSVNTTSRIDEVNSQTSEQMPPYYVLEKAVRLHHDRPWTVEFRMKGTMGFIMGPSATFGSGLPYLLKTHDHFHGGQSFTYTEIDEETGKEVSLVGRNQYGVEFTKFGYSKTPWYTFRLENRVNSDGSNMPYLFVDGTELGPMNDYCINKNSKNYDQAQKVDWFNGQDLSISYLFNKNFRFDPSISMDYIQIWENGENNAPHSYYTTKTVAPTCTGKGYVSHICSQCGDTWNDNFVAPLGHKLGAYTKKNDKLHSRTCTVCGEEQVDVHTVENGACTLCDYSASKSVAGTWTTDLTLSAAELGVNAPDSVLRATLTFTDEGKASATWEAVDLTALSLFFRDMFVSSYYAMAYGSGITEIQQIEQFCMDSTGLSVSAYMDTIVTDEALKVSFTPPSTQGTYRYDPKQTSIFTDLALMEVPSDPNVPNSFTVGNGIMYLNANSWGKPDYTFVCKAK